MLSRYLCIHRAEVRQPHLQLVPPQLGQFPIAHDGHTSRSSKLLRQMPPI